MKASFAKGLTIKQNQTLSPKLYLIDAHSSHGLETAVTVVMAHAHQNPGNYFVLNWFHVAIRILPTKNESLEPGPASGDKFQGNNTNAIAATDDSM